MCSVSFGTLINQLDYSFSIEFITVKIKIHCVAFQNSQNRRDYCMENSARN